MSDYYPKVHTYMNNNLNFAKVYKGRRAPNRGFAANHNELKCT